MNCVNIFMQKTSYFSETHNYETKEYYETPKLIQGTATFFPKDIYTTTTKSNCEISKMIPCIRNLNVFRLFCLLIVRTL